MRCNKIDYEFKAKVLREHSDLVKKERQASRNDFLKSFYGIIEGFSSNDLLNDNMGLIPELLEASKINKATYQRIKRLKNRVSEILQNNECLFLTLTFTDKAIEETTPKDRRVAVSRYLKSYNAKYVANIDFGKLDTYKGFDGVLRAGTHREHYHALISTNKIDHNYWYQHYGCIFAEKIRLNKKDNDVKLSKYIAKLTNHAIKETTKRSALIYSR